MRINGLFSISYEFPVLLVVQRFRRIAFANAESSTVTQRYVDARNVLELVRVNAHTSLRLGLVLQLALELVKQSAGKGSKIMAITDGNGVPIAVYLASASPHETKQVEPTAFSCAKPTNSAARKSAMPKATGWSAQFYSNIPFKHCKIKGSMCSTMDRILTIGTSMEQISHVYRHHRHQQIQNYDSCKIGIRFNCGYSASRTQVKSPVPSVDFINVVFTAHVACDHSRPSDETKSFILTSCFTGGWRY